MGLMDRGRWDARPEAPPRQGLMDRFYQQGGLAGLMGMEPADVTISRLNDVTRSYLAQGQFPPVEAIAQHPMLGFGVGNIKAYHGSPHHFTKFDMSKVGMGQGAQTYGRGLYFAENPKVAESYLKQLAPGRGGRPVDTAQRLLEAAGGDRQRAAAIGRERLAWAAKLPPKNRSNDPTLSNAVKLLESGEQFGGRVYKVNLKVEPDDLLVYEKPLSQQSPKIKAALRKVYPDLNIDEAHSVYANPRHPAEVRKLREAGILGLQYLDEGSRAEGQGTRNFVIFDDELIEMLD